MSFIPNGFGEIIYRYGFVNDPEDKTVSLGFRSELGGTVGNLDDAGAAALAAWVDTFHSTGAPTLAVPWEFRGVVIRYKVADVEYLLEGGTPIVGSATTSVVTTNTGILVKKRTGLSGRGNRGRLYPPPYNLDEADVEPTGEIDSTIVGDYQAQFDALLLELTSNDVQPVILHAMVLDDPGPPPVYVPPTDPPVDITAFLVTPKAATQRRRMR